MLKALRMRFLPIFEKVGTTIGMTNPNPLSFGKPKTNEKLEKPKMYPFPGPLTAIERKWVGKFGWAWK